MKCLYCEDKISVSDSYAGTCRGCCESGKMMPIGRTELANYKARFGVAFTPKKKLGKNEVWKPITAPPKQGGYVVDGGGGASPKNGMGYK